MLIICSCRLLYLSLSAALSIHNRWTPLHTHFRVLAICKQCWFSFALPSPWNNYRNAKCSKCGCTIYSKRTNIHVERRATMYIDESHAKWAFSSPESKCSPSIWFSVVWTYTKLPYLNVNQSGFCLSFPPFTHSTQITAHRHSGLLLLSTLSKKKQKKNTKQWHILDYMIGNRNGKHDPGRLASEWLQSHSKFCFNAVATVIFVVVAVQQYDGWVLPEPRRHTRCKCRAMPRINGSQISYCILRFTAILWWLMHHTQCRRLLSFNVNSARYVCASHRVPCVATTFDFSTNNIINVHIEWWKRRRCRPKTENWFASCGAIWIGQTSTQQYGRLQFHSYRQNGTMGRRRARTIFYTYCIWYTLE